MKTLALVFLLSGIAATFANTVGVYYGVPLWLRCIAAGIAGGIIGWIMRRFRDPEGD